MALCIALNKAVKRELIGKTLFYYIPLEEKPKKGERKREYLTLGKVLILTDTECKDVRVKQFFLYSCFKGLRYKDIYYLRWRTLRNWKGGL